MSIKENRRIDLLMIYLFWKNHSNCAILYDMKRREHMTERKIIKAGLLGLGTVGTGVYKLAKRQKEEIEKKQVFLCRLRVSLYIILKRREKEWIQVF